MPTTEPKEPLALSPQGAEDYKAWMNAVQTRDENEHFCVFSDRCLTQGVPHPPTTCGTSEMLMHQDVVRQIAKFEHSLIGMGYKLVAPLDHREPGRPGIYLYTDPTGHRHVQKAISLQEVLDFGDELKELLMQFRDAKMAVSLN